METLHGAREGLGTAINEGVGTMERRYQVRPETDPMAWMQVDPSTSPPALMGVQLWFDPSDGALQTAMRYSIDGTPAAIYCGRVFSWTIPHGTDPRRFTREINTGSLDALLDRIVAGYDKSSSGRPVLSGDAWYAHQEIGEWIASWEWTLPGENAGLVDAYDWFEGSSSSDFETLGLRSDSADDELAALAAQLDENARQESVVLTGTVEYLRRCRDDL